MAMKINKLEIENVKRVKAVKIEPTANGLTIIGGNNNQGKTSVLDAIAWALGGDKYRPSQKFSNTVCQSKYHRGTFDRVLGNTISKHQTAFVSKMFLKQDS